ncbi:hypothetical protein ABIA39_007367 [Nocardia sp. GAS34]|uniref:hypothetical protein n=1 Tax=unclassified Nocardia TaxID=2637762 RepID=UPI003D1E2B63
MGADRIAAEIPARRIAEACGHLPLAVRIMVTRLAARPGWSMAAVAQRLADERRRLSELSLGEVPAIDEIGVPLGARRTMTPAVRLPRWAKWCARGRNPSAIGSKHDRPESLEQRDD